MKAVFCLLAFNVLCFAQSAAPNPRPPKLLLQILHCAETDKFGLLDASLTDAAIKVSWHHSPASGSGVGEEFFIVLPNSEKGGEILVYVREYKSGKVHLYLVNSATFSIEHGE